MTKKCDSFVGDFAQKDSIFLSDMSLMEFRSAVEPNYKEMIQ